MYGDRDGAGASDYQRANEHRASSVCCAIAVSRVSGICLGVSDKVKYRKPNNSGALENRESAIYITIGQ